MGYALQHFLESEAGVYVCGKIYVVDTLARELRAHKPDLLILDCAIAGKDGLTVLARVRSMYPNMGLLVLSERDQCAQASMILRAGADGYVIKEDSMQEIVWAIRCILDGGQYVSPTLAHLVIDASGADKDMRPLSLLSDHEREVGILLARGYDTREIASIIRRSVKTVETYYARTKKKLGCKSLRELRQIARDEWL